MRCYFTRDGQIQGVENLLAAEEAAAITESQRLFGTLGKARRAEGFEVWNSGRCIYRFPATASAGRKPRSVARLLKLWDRLD
jgi:hypothetical protein